MRDHSSCRGHNPLHCIIPPIILERLAKSADKRVRDRALENLQIAAQFRATRAVVSALPTAAIEGRRAGPAEAAARGLHPGQPQPARPLPARAAGARRARPGERRPGGRRGVQLRRLDLAALQQDLRTQLARRPGHDARAERPRRHRLRQRVLGRAPDGLRRRRRRDLHALHQVGRRRRTRADPRRRAVHLGARVLRRERRAQRALRRRLRQPGEASTAASRPRRAPTG